MVALQARAVVLAPASKAVEQLVVEAQLAGELGLQPSVDCSSAASLLEFAQPIAATAPWSHLDP